MAAEVRERQIAEAESLEAIFGEDFSAQGAWTDEKDVDVAYSVTLSPTVTIRCRLPVDYPESARLQVELAWTGVGDVPRWRKRLEEYLDSLPLGQEMAYDVVTWCQEHLVDGLAEESQLAASNGDAPVAEARSGQALTPESSPASVATPQAVSHKVENRLPKSCYFRAEALGEGACGSVMHVYDEDGQEWAAKQFESAEDGTVDTTTLREIGLLRSLCREGTRHPNIVALADMATINGELCMIMASYKCSLRDAVLGGALAATKGSHVRIAGGLLGAVTFLHVGCKTMHRDIKPGNVMLTDDLDPVLIDFSLAKVIDAQAGEDRAPRTAKERRRKARGKTCVKEEDGQQERHSGGVGTPVYMAPEVLACEEYGFPADMWSLGVVLLQVFDSDFSAKLEECEKEKAAYALIAETVGRLGPKPIPSLLHALLEVSPASRVSSQVALERFDKAVPHGTLRSDLSDIKQVQLSALPDLSAREAARQAVSDNAMAEIRAWSSLFCCSGRVLRYAEAYFRQTHEGQPLFAIVLASKLHETDPEAAPLYDLDELLQWAQESEDDGLLSGLQCLEDYPPAEKRMLRDLDYLLY